MQPFEKKMNEWGEKKQPFLFIIDFKKNNAHLFNLNERVEKDVFFKTPSFSNLHDFNKCISTTVPTIKNKLLDYNVFLQSFYTIKQAIEKGESYLANLTCSVLIESNATLADFFINSNALYKLYFQNQFICFSPECFIEINNNEIKTFPMKGTIDADLPQALENIMNDKKEISEHATVVDLLRNDLSMVASNVVVKKFRYPTYIKNEQTNLIQISSEICGTLPKNWQKNIGTILNHLLPAGSISGAPKKQTLQIIQNAETHNRDFYCGVFGIFDGQKVESGVMIRFIEQQKTQLVYKSGAGITANSKPLSEYQEILDKVYVPIF